MFQFWLHFLQATERSGAADRPKAGCREPSMWAEQGVRIFEESSCILLQLPCSAREDVTMHSILNLTPHCKHLSEVSFRDTFCN